MKIYNKDLLKKVPFVQHRRIIDGDRLRELVNDVRLNINQELKEAKEIEKESQRILSNAKASAEDIVRRAEDKAEQLVSHEAIVIEARKQAMEMITKAQNSSKTIQQNAALAIAKMLNDTEAHYTKNIQNIKIVKSKISNTLKNSTTFNNNFDEK